MSTTNTAYIGLGSNLASRAGGPHQTLGAAIARLQDYGEVTARSSFYETEPVGYIDQPRFLNAVVSLRTKLSPIELLTHLLAIEREFGRERSQTQLKGPRTLDLDLLFMGEIVLDSQDLTIPHPAIAERRFVLQPLAEIAPEVMHPVFKKKIGTLLAELPDEGENRIAAVNIP